jgi:hypothetical protein
MHNNDAKMPNLLGALPPSQGKVAAHCQSSAHSQHLLRSVMQLNCCRLMGTGFILLPVERS